MFITEMRELAHYIKKGVKNYYKNRTNPPLTYQEFKRKRQIEKIDDPRRIRIYSKVDLTDEQELEIDRLFIDNYGQIVPHVWHRYYTAYTGNFDINYFPELLYIPEFEFYMNQEKSYATVLEDKNFLPLIAKGADIKMPHNIVSCIQGLYRDMRGTCVSRKEVEGILFDIGKVFVKPSVMTSSGQGCCIADIKEDIDTISHQRIDDLLNELGEDYCIQNVVICSEAIRKLYDKSVNTFRIITYRWKNDIITMPMIMRIGRGGGVVDNAHAGGIFIAVDNNGDLHKTAFTEFNEQFDCHPDSKVQFENYNIPNVDKVLQAAKRMHENVPNIGVVNWDFTIDENEQPLLIEANVFQGSIWLIEMAHGKGPFGEKTKEVLQWLKLMNSLPPSEYKTHMFGY